jgi:hypothetical protein
VLALQQVADGDRGERGEAGRDGLSRALHGATLLSDPMPSRGWRTAASGFAGPLAQPGLAHDQAVSHTVVDP